jgi:DNA-binding NtrC family response regulator
LAADRIGASAASHHPPASRRRRAERALANCHGNKSKAAAALGVTRKTLYAWLEADDAAAETH